MTRPIAKFSVTAMVALASVLACAQPRVSDIELAPAPSWRVSFHGLQVQRGAQNLVVSGYVRRSAIDPQRRGFLPVWAEVLGPEGGIIGRGYGDTHRQGGGSHTVRGRFVISIEDLPENATAIRVGYGWHG